MMIHIHIPPLLQEITSNRETIEVAGTTVRECTDDLKRKFPAFNEWLNESNPIAWVTVNRKIVGVAEMDQKSVGV